jgi:cell wall-associated NlpC family hydrolase
LVRWRCAVFAMMLAVLPCTQVHAAQGSDGQGGGQASTSAPIVYTVQPGDSVHSIAQRFGASPTAIVEANRLGTTHRLVVGHTIIVPSVAPGDSATVQAAAAPVALQSGASMPGPAGNPRQANPMALAGPMSASVPGWPAAPTIPSMVGPSSSQPAPRVPAANLSVGAPLANVGAPRAGSVSAVARPAEMAVPAANQALAVQIALDFSGAPYMYGGAGPTGFDCSGFVQYVMDRAGRPVPRDLFGQYTAGSHPETLVPGDLVFFQNTYDVGLSHVGIYLGNSQFIHAISEGSGVGISNLNEPYYAERWYGATRLPEPAFK